MAVQPLAMCQCLTLFDVWPICGHFWCRFWSDSLTGPSLRNSVGNPTTCSLTLGETVAQTYTNKFELLVLGR